LDFVLSDQLSPQGYKVTTNFDQRGRELCPALSEKFWGRILTGSF
jgi:hypothetical protein